MYTNNSTMDMSVTVLQSLRGESGQSYQGQLPYGAGAFEAANEHLAKEVTVQRARYASALPKMVSPPTPDLKLSSDKVAEATRRRNFLEKKAEEAKRAKDSRRHKFLNEELEEAKRVEAGALRENEAAKAVRRKRDLKATKMKKREAALKEILGRPLDIKLANPCKVAKVAKTKKKPERVKGIAYVTNRRRESERD